MKITWINHAGFLIESNEIALVSDPWIEGKVFHNGWDLLSKSQFTYEDFSRVTHIWFSHEHPDHFNPPNLSKIAESIRKNITVIFQKTEDKKVKGFCEKLGFKQVIELPPSSWYTLGNDFKVINQSDRSGDSWLGIRAEAMTLLNMNDVVTYSSAASLARIAAHVGKVHVLLTQFSFASWGGNENNPEYRRKMAKEKLEILSLQANTFKPEFLVPFASFVWFCRTENYYHNAEANEISKTVEFIEQQTGAIPVVLYPGDQWDVINKRDNLQSLANYSRDGLAMLHSAELVKTKSVTMSELVELGKDFVSKLKAFHSTFLLGIKLKQPAKLFLSDLNQACILTLSGVQPAAYEQGECDIQLTSEVFAYCLKFNWGGDSLNVNGCFQVPPKGSVKRFQDYFYFAKLINMGIHYNLVKVWQNVSRKYLGKEQ